MLITEVDYGLLSGDQVGPVCSYCLRTLPDVSDSVVGPQREPMCRLCCCEWLDGKVWNASQRKWLAAPGAKSA